jgi:hypothetical protein
MLPFGWSFIRDEVGFHVAGSKNTNAKSYSNREGANVNNAGVKEQEVFSGDDNFRMKETDVFTIES